MSNEEKNSQLNYVLSYFHSEGEMDGNSFLEKSVSE